MEPDWQPADSGRIVAEAYDPESEIIYVRFRDGTEWCYEACPPDVWEQFTTPGQSRNAFINAVLDYKPHHRFTG